jgi:hypothetical protein
VLFYCGSLTFFVHSVPSSSSCNRTFRRRKDNILHILYCSVALSFLCVELTLPQNVVKTSRLPFYALDLPYSIDKIHTGSFITTIWPLSQIHPATTTLYPALSLCILSRGFLPFHVLRRMLSSSIHMEKKYWLLCCIVWCSTV